MHDTGKLAAWVIDARQRTFDLISDLSDEELMGPRLDIVNPLLWEIGHVAWFQERWSLRHAAGQKPYRPEVDSLYDSIAIHHDTRWDLPLFSRAETLSYLEDVRDRVVARLESEELGAEDIYFILLPLFHEDMHDEAFTYTRQTLGYGPPRFTADPGAGAAPEADSDVGKADGDVEVPGGEFFLGAARDEPFVFDNEKWAHPVTLEPFAISRAPVTQEEFAAFVGERGYSRRELWSDAGWRWRESTGAELPVHWRREPGGGWARRHFDVWRPLEARFPVIHVNWYEAEAWCRWARRRLPTEAEWEAAAASRASGDALSAEKSRFPWGDDPVDAHRANTDWRRMGCADVGAHPEGDSAFGCRQMIGNVWEWTASDFVPYPGFRADPYREYSEPWFGDHKVLRGGCWVTRGRMLRNTWRNFYKPDRRDVWAGFRTCAP